MTIVCGMFKKSSDTACSKNCIICCYCFIITFFIVTNNTSALVTVANKVNHCEVFYKGYIFTASCSFQKMRGYFLSCFILMKKNSRSGMCTLFGIIKGFTVLFKADTEGYQILNNSLRRANHNIY